MGAGPPEALGMVGGAGDLMAAPLPEFYLHPKIRGEEPVTPAATENVAGSVTVTVAVDGRIEVGIASMRPTEAIGVLEVAIDLIKIKLLHG